MLPLTRAYLMLVDKELISCPEGFLMGGGVHVCVGGGEGKLHPTPYLLPHPHTTLPHPRGKQGPGPAALVVNGLWFTDSRGERDSWLF